MSCKMMMWPFVSGNWPRGKTGNNFFNKPRPRQGGPRSQSPSGSPSSRKDCLPWLEMQSVFFRRVFFSDDLFTRRNSEIVCTSDNFFSSYINFCESGRRADEGRADRQAAEGKQERLTGGFHTDVSHWSTCQSH